MEKDRYLNRYMKDIFGVRNPKEYMGLRIFESRICPPRKKKIMSPLRK
jgi:hypothetical protein